MEKQYYKDYHRAEQKHWWFKARSKILLSHCEQLVLGMDKVKILNIGVATGQSTVMLGKLGNVTSVEYDKDCCEFLKNKTGIEVVNASILDLPFEDQSFDLVCAFDVIEHVEDDHRAMGEMKRVCKKGGKICVTVPAFMFLWSAHDKVNHHFRRYTRRQLMRLLDQSDQVIFASYFNFWLFIPIAFFRIVSRLLNIKKSDLSAPGQGSSLGGILYRIFHAENYFLSKQIRLPFGVSILLSAHKL